MQCETACNSGSIACSMTLAWVCMLYNIHACYSNMECETACNSGSITCSMTLAWVCMLYNIH